MREVKYTKESQPKEENWRTPNKIFKDIYNIDSKQKGTVYNLKILLKDAYDLKNKDGSDGVKDINLDDFNLAIKGFSKSIAINDDIKSKIKPRSLSF